MQADAAPRNSVDGNGADDEPLAYTVPQAARKLAISPRSMWHLVHTDQIESFKIGARNAPGAVPFTLPQTPPVPRFDNGPVVFFEVNVCGGLDVDQVGPAHCGSSGPHRWHDLLNP
jgi:hypothetical protein